MQLQSCYYRKIRVLTVLFILQSVFIPMSAFAIGSNFDYYTKVKFEYQYSDYLEYAWPSQIEYVFGEYSFRQPNPLLASFPEHRSLLRVTQAFGTRTEVQAMYHYSFLGRNYYLAPDGSRSQWNKDETLYNTRVSYKAQDNLTVSATAQYSVATGNALSADSDRTAALKGWMFDAGCEYDFAGFFKVEPSISIFTNKIDTSESGAQSYNLKLRQSLNNTAAAQVKYSFFHTDAIGDQPGLEYHTVTFWLSKWLPTQTAVHLFFRYHQDNQNSKSSGPGIEISQYLDWATTMTLSYRNYGMKNTDPESTFSQAIDGDKFTSDAYSLLLSRTFWNDTVVTLKYRYYTCNQDVRMNTYLLGIEQVF